MRLLMLFSALCLFACNSGEQKNQGTSGPSKNSNELNASVASAMTAYYQLTEAFVRYDSANVPSLANQLGTKLDSITVTDVDTIAVNFVLQAKRQADLIAEQNSMEEKRHALNSLSDHLFQFLKNVEYDRTALYLQECPMAFNDTEPGIWLAAGDSIRNPYLGLFHPRYGRGMLKCGENKEVINNTGSGSETSGHDGHQH